MQPRFKNFVVNCIFLTSFFSDLVKYQSANDTSVLEVAVEISVSRSSDLEKDNYHNIYEYRRKLISEKSVSTDTRKALKNQHQDLAKTQKNTKHAATTRIFSAKCV